MEININIKSIIPFKAELTNENRDKEIIEKEMEPIPSNVDLEELSKLLADSLESIMPCQ